MSDRSSANSPRAAPSGSARLGSYLRQLREGYGYTLRKVEESSVSYGEAIDNSQLSRFEKGKAVPSFDKLRALARVFNVPVQSFSDVLDLEEFQHLKPTSGDHDGLLAAGAEWMVRGEPGRAFVTFERAFELATGDDAGEQRAEARWRMATSLKRLGKLYMTEHELRSILREQPRVSARARMRALLQLGYLYRELGDLYIAAVLLRECLELARESADVATEAGVQNAFGNIRDAEGRSDEALEAYQQARSLLAHVEGHEEKKAVVLTNLGGSLVATGDRDRGMALLREAHGNARKGGYRRVAALALTRLAEAMRAVGENDQFRALLAESDVLASSGDSSYHDILFLNAFHRWRFVQSEENGTGERIAFGRLRHLRSLLQRRFPEVDEFDLHVKEHRR